MRNGDEKSGDFLRLLLEGEEIKKEVEGDKMVEGLQVSPQMDRKMWCLIEAYEQNNAKKIKIF